ncbi:hypothetical protein BMS3Bbin16_01070 [archaeon BMS3Bbin16]|nr:hypothetical protein BMS3Bbin16_01070 [archaeon BMS3Bbin16]
MWLDGGILIFGGPDAYAGVGSITKEVLSTEEQKYLNVDGNAAVYVKTGVVE